MPSSTPKQRARKLLRDMGVEQPPIDVKTIVERHQIRLRVADIGDDVSGVLMIKDGEAVIGYNRTQSKTRQRFSIAHELGHFLLHSRVDELFIDKGALIMYRDGASATGDDPREREANAFAAELLMPDAMIRNEIKTRDLRLTDDRDIEVLAEIFDVSTQAMTIRLMNLGIIVSGL